MANLNLGTISRDYMGSGDNSNTYFPRNLSLERYVNIKIYDTTNKDPNKELLGLANDTVNSVKTAFSNKSELKSLTTGDTTDNNFIENAGTYVGGVANALGEGIKNSAKAGEIALKQYTDYMSSLGDHGFGNKKLADDFKDNLWLPLPNELTESLSHQYQSEHGFAQGIITSDFSGIKLLTKTSNNISKATGTQKLLYNENRIAQFEGSDFRSITLTWTLIPNNSKEADDIQTIVTKLKAYSSPQAIAGKLLLRAPFYCKLEFQNKIINDALQFNEVVITNIEVNYSVTGNMETFNDDMPKTMQLSITFQDREPKTLQAWSAAGDAGYEIDMFSNKIQDGKVTETNKTK